MEKLQTCEFLAFTMIPIWHFSMLFFLSIVQMGVEWRDAGVAVRREREYFDLVQQTCVAGDVSLFGRWLINGLLDACCSRCARCSMDMLQSRGFKGKCLFCVRGYGMFRLLFVIIVLSHENLQMQEYIDDRSRGPHGHSPRSILTTRRANGICYSPKLLSVFLRDRGD